VIDKNGHVRCDNCGKEHVLKLVGSDFTMEWYCPRCKHFQRDESKMLDKAGNIVIVSNR